MTDDFFPPIPPEEEEHAQNDVEPLRRPWMGPPEDTLGSTVALDLILAKTEDVALTVPSVTVYPGGLSIGLVLWGRMFDSLTHVLAHEDLTPPFDPGAGRDPSMDLRFGVQLPDGSKATVDPKGPHLGQEPPSSPYLAWTGSGGGERHYRHGFWLWPLPPAGSLDLVVEWRAARIPLTRTSIDGQLFVRAADRASTLWDEVPEAGHASSSSGRFSIGAIQVDEEEDDHR